MAEDWQAGGFGIYIHWPFCVSKCPYCDFNSHVDREIDQTRWASTYLREIDRYADEVPDRVVSSVFFGGGTPSLMAPETVAAIIDRIRMRWPVANDLEITLEANPGSVEAGRFRAYRAGGVNRLSMGIQALNDTDLRRLGRLHSVDEALKAHEIARSVFDRVSFDLIYARQDQSLDDWQSELSQALALQPDHLSLYQLTIEDGTAFGDLYHAGRLRGLPDDDLGADMYLATQDICNAAGLEAYEVSNHAKPGAESRHNLVYWRYGDYVGIGPGAHGRLTMNGAKHATDTATAPADWLAQAERGNGELMRTTLSGADQAGEYLLMGLRISQGIDLTRYSRLLGSNPDQPALDRLLELDMIDITGHRLRVTNRGRMVLNAVITELMPG